MDKNIFALLEYIDSTGREWMFSATPFGYNLEIYFSEINDKISIWLHEKTDNPEKYLINEIKKELDKLSGVKTERLKEWQNFELNFNIKNN